MKDSSIQEPANWLLGGGEMGQLIREKDWSKTPLGPMASWSPTLKMMVSFLLANRFPQLLWWGDQHCQLYNDPYRPVLGSTKHPQAMGQTGRECWPEIWEILEPLVETPYHGGPPTWMEDIPLEINRHGFVEETHFTIAYSPVPDETVPSGIGGVLATVHEISEKVVSERRILVLRELGVRQETKSAKDACVTAAETLGKHSKDIPFCLLYLIDNETKQARLSGISNITKDTQLSPEVVDPGSASDQQTWNFAEVFQTEKLHVIEDLSARFGDSVPPGPWSDPPRQAVVAPIFSNVPHQLAGFLVAGLSSRLRFDQSYQTFIELVAGQISAVVINARAYEAERLRAEALAELDQAKTAFFSNVSHEFRTPLTLMLGPIEDILNDLSLPEQAQKKLEVAHRNSLRLLKLVNTLLDFSRIEANRMRASYEPIDLARFTTDLASAFRSTIERAEMKLTVHCDPLERPVYVDREMWEKIVFNLLSNAYKYTFKGEISVTLKHVQDYVELHVQDTGTGIPTKELPHIFKRFHRVEGARGRSHEGSGIGLALVQELVKLHGGTVQVSSQPGEGSMFVVSIPFGPSHLPSDRIVAVEAMVQAETGRALFAKDAQPWISDAPLPDKENATQVSEKNSPAIADFIFPARILVADDNADMREYVTRLLADRYEVISVGDGLSALKMAVQDPPDLILTDVMMPELDGFGLLQSLRANEATASIPIILLSARAGEEAHVQGMEAGADDYLIKPFSAKELLARVKAHLEIARVRRKSLNAVRRSEDRFRELADNIDQLAWTADKLGQATWYNKRWCEYTGASFETMKERGWESVHHPDHLDRVRENLQETFARGEIWEDTFPLRDKNGEYHWFLSRAVPIRNKDGEIVRWFGTNTDITRHREQEKRLALIAQVGELTRMNTDVSQLLFAVARAVGKHFGVNRCLFNEIDVEQDRETVYSDYFQDVPSVAGVHKISDYSSITSEDMKAQRTVVNEDSKTDPRTSKDYSKVYEPNQERSYVAIPLFRENRWVASLWVSSREPRNWSREEVTLLEEIASRTWATVEKIRSEAALQQSEQRFRSLVHVITDIAWSTDAEGAIVTFQPEWAKYTGQSWEDMRGLGWENAIHPADRATLHEQWVNACATGTLFEARGRLWHSPSRQYRFVLAHATPLLNPDGKIREWVGSYTDIHERKAAEDSLLRQVKLLESSLQPVFTWKPKGGIIQWNKGCEELYGFSRQEALGKVSHDLLGSVFPNGFKEFEADLFRDGVWFGEVQHKTRNGNQLIIESRQELVEIDGEFIVFESNRDITSKKQLELLNNQLLEQERKARIEAEEVNRMKDQFLATVSHELRTPLNAILGWAHILQSKTLEAGVAKSAVEAIFTGARNQAQIIDDLLDVARIISGKMTLKPETVKLSDCLSAALDTVTHAMKAKNIHVDLHYLRKEGIVLYADPQRLQQVFWNLLSNAVKFTPAGGRIEIQTEQTSTEAIIVFRDTGIGISHEFLPSVFERFRQADSSTTRKFGGVGLGLSIVKHFIELHGGTISAESEGEGLGSTFTIRLPLTVAPPIETPYQEQLSIPVSIENDYNTSLPGKKILLVDDDVVTLHMISEVFAIASAEVRVSSSAKDGFELLKSWGPDLLISDIAMPENDGFWLIQQVRSLGNQTANIPTIALTAYASSIDRTKILDSGFQLFLPKPVIPADLLKAAGDLLGQREP